MWCVFDWTVTWFHKLINKRVNNAQWSCFVCHTAVTMRINIQTKVCPVAHRHAASVCHTSTPMCMNIQQRHPLLHTGTCSFNLSHIHTYVHKHTTKTSIAAHNTHSNSDTALEWCCMGSRDRSQGLECQTGDWRIMGLSPSKTGGRIFFSRVNFPHWLLFRYPLGYCNST